MQGQGERPRRCFIARSMHWQSSAGVMAACQLKSRRSPGEESCGLVWAVQLHPVPSGRLTMTASLDFLSRKFRWRGEVSGPRPKKGNLCHGRTTGSRESKSRRAERNLRQVRWPAAGNYSEAISSQILWSGCSVFHPHNFSERRQSRTIQGRSKGRGCGSMPTSWEPQ